MDMGFAPTWLRQVSPLLHMTTLTTAYICTASCNLLNTQYAGTFIIWKNGFLLIYLLTYPDILSQNYVVLRITVLQYSLNSAVCLIQQNWVWAKLKLTLRFTNPGIHGHSSFIISANYGPVGQILRYLDCYGWFMKWIWVTHFTVQNILWSPTWTL